MVRVAINGYGRIGRTAHRVILQWHHDEIDVVAINAGSSTDIEGWMYLLKYDSVYGLLPQEISVKPNEDASKKDLLGTFVIEGKEIPVYSQKDPTMLPWKDLNVDVVIESTGAFTTAEKLQTHLTAGAKTVVLSAPAKGEGVPTYVISINEDKYSGEKIINNASCTTNCITPVAKILQDHFGIEKAMMTTVHAYTSDQKVHDGGHKDHRRARAAALNIVPTSTGASTAAGEAFPPLKGIFGGLSIRVPVPVGSLADFTFLLKKDVTIEEVNDVFSKEAENPIYKGVLAVTNDPIVSSDIIGNSHSSIVDLSLTQVVGGNMLKVIAWYDNEYGYANRLVEQTLTVGAKLGGSSTPTPVTPVDAPAPSMPAAPTAMPTSTAPQQEAPAPAPQDPLPTTEMPAAPAPTESAPAAVVAPEQPVTPVPGQEPAPTQSETPAVPPTTTDPMAPQQPTQAPVQPPTDK